MVQEAHHSHPVDVHLAACVLEGAELQRTAYAHTGIVDEDVDASLGIDDLLDGCFTVLIRLHVGPYVGDAGEQVLGLAVRAVDLVPVGGQPLRHRAAES